MQAPFAAGSGGSITQLSPLFGGSSVRIATCALSVLVATLLGCTEAQEQPKAPAPKAPSESAAAASDSEAPTRRARQGIELTKAEGQERVGDKKGAPTRVPAAEFINTSPPSKAPGLDGGERDSDVSSALRWIETQWSKAAQSEDKEGYRALLHEDFKGHAFGANEVIDRASWPKVRQPPLGTTLTHGLPYVTANPNNTSRVSVRFKERYEREGACTFTTRTLSLEPRTAEGNKTWQITSEEALKAQACPEASLREVQGAHQALGIAWQGKDMSATQGSIFGGFQLLDGGVEAAQYNHAALTTGAGRWVLDQVSTLQAGEKNTHIVGDTAIISGAEGVKLAYRLSAGVWRLTALWRPTQLK